MSDLPVATTQAIRKVAEDAMNVPAWHQQRKLASTPSYPKCLYCGNEFHHSTNGACSFVFQRPFTVDEITQLIEAAYRQGAREAREQLDALEVKVREWLETSRTEAVEKSRPKIYRHGRDCEAATLNVILTELAALRASR